MLENTSSDKAPWFIVPADDKWFTRIVIANIIVNELSKLDLRLSIAHRTAKKRPGRSKKILTGETESPAVNNE